MRPMEIALAVVEPKLNPQTARIELDSIKGDYVEWEAKGFNLRKRIYRFEFRGGAEALAYGSMEALIEAEFPDQCYKTVMAQLEAARVELIVNPDGEIGTLPRNLMRLLHPFVAEPEEARQMFDAAKDEDGMVTEESLQEVIDATPYGKATSQKAASRNGAARNGKGTKGKGTKGKGTKGKGTKGKGTKGAEKGPELTSSPKKAFRTWELFVADLNNHHLWIREHGGIKVHTKDWRPDQLDYVRGHLVRFIPFFEGWIGELEEVRS